MLSRSVLTELMTTHVLAAGERIGEVDEQRDRVLLATDQRRFVITYEPDEWLIGREPWIADLVMVTRDDARVHGQPERFAFLVPTGAQELFVNNPDTMAALGNRLHDGMDPVGYAELLVQFHPYSSATRDVLTAADDLRRIFALETLPDAEPLALAADGDDLVLTFQSCVRYRRPGTLALLDVYDWRVTVPAAEPASWRSDLALEAIPLH